MESKSVEEYIDIGRSLCPRCKSDRIFPISVCLSTNEVSYRYKQFRTFMECSDCKLTGPVSAVGIEHKKATYSEAILLWNKYVEIYRE